uniref:G-protein coupled receptors family 1 profile domain-containing protein n=1 Tax=Romanomermis culicivorax TaxID=13658 RepID=A0A915KD27_ROMCU
MDNVTFHSELSIIGKSYLALGIFGITCNLIDLAAIPLLKDDSPLKNPFYFFMLNLCIADLLCLTGLACYTGLTFCRVDAFLTTFLQRFFGFLIDANYYSSGWFHFLISLSRFLVFGEYSGVFMVRKQSKQIVPLANNRSGNLEIKLFVQCLISSSIYCASATSFAIFAQINQLPNTMLLVAHLLWILDHMNNSILFLLMDKDLR